MQGTYCWKVHSVGYKAISDNTGLPSFVFSCCFLPNLQNPRNSLKIRTYSSSRSSKVIALGTNGKCIFNFLLVIIIVTLDVSPIVFEILTHLTQKQFVLHRTTSHRYREQNCLRNRPWTVLGCKAGDEVAAPSSLVCWQTAERKQHTDCHGTTPKPVHSSTPDRSWISPSPPPPRWVSDSAVPTIWHRTA